jgi:hypothetical protein
MALAEFFGRQFIAEEFDARTQRRPLDNPGWTAHLSRVAAAIGEKAGFYRATQEGKDEFDRSEYLGIDTLYFEKGHRPHGSRGVTFPLPSITIEFENLPNKVLYDYWKLLSVRSKLRVLVFVLPDIRADLPNILQSLSGMRAEHPALDGEDLLLVGAFGIGNSEALLSPFVWRQSNFASLVFE